MRVFGVLQGRLSGRGVLLRARLIHSVCRIDVCDNGIGIAESDYNKIWEPYAQISEKSRNRENGLGLGLFLVKIAISRLPNHAINLRSRMGRGSRFSIALPGRYFLGEENEELTSGCLGNDRLLQLHGAYAVLLENDLDARRAIEDLLRDWGVIISGASNLDDLIMSESSSDRLIDVFITSYHGEGQRNGADLVIELRERLEVQVISVLITGDLITKEMESSLPHRTTLLRKPFSPDALAKAILLGADENRKAEREI